MVDTLTPAQRSERMSRIRSRDTKPEIALRKALHRLGFRFRVHRTGLPGKPDMVLAKYRTVIFVHGCFWHRHEGCKVATTPKSNTEFWNDKFSRNVERDKQVLKQLEDDGWYVVIVWECELDTHAKAASTADVLGRNLRMRLAEKWK
ncbi:DNA mismatch endonuclease Vsr [Rhizobium leguminosarum]|uniref:very short patch repair endonuclease n=1 Tax=Rhizobium leguminosarum TaxID=384 RepID=UPI001C962E6A|nr:DNA mismatch endonuclease Vsr [Rhizobium leguminosarum]MBY5460766.1 DNA mismatch endonuclease Vsr [Rhizobium leguminosarum]